MDVVFLVLGTDEERGLIAWSSNHATESKEDRDESDR